MSSSSDVSTDEGNLRVISVLNLAFNADGASRFEELSRGERARVALARALVSSPD